MFGIPRPREAANAAVWQARQRRCVEAIQAARPDVAMLQEIYLMDECVQLYTQAFESEYNLFFHRRPGKMACSPWSGARCSELWGQRKT